VVELPRTELLVLMAMVAMVVVAVTEELV